MARLLTFVALLLWLCFRVFAVPALPVLEELFEAFRRLVTLITQQYCPTPEHLLPAGQPRPGPPGLVLVLQEALAHEAPHLTSFASHGYCEERVGSRPRSVLCVLANTCSQHFRGEVARRAR